jgi:hypothetical protein
MYLIINQSINLLLKKINIMRAEMCLLGYYLTTTLCKAFNNKTYTVVTIMCFIQLLPTYYQLLPLHGNYPKKSYNKLNINQLQSSCR